VCVGVCVHWMQPSVEVWGNEMEAEMELPHMDSHCVQCVCCVCVGVFVCVCVYWMQHVEEPERCSYIFQCLCAVCAYWIALLAQVEVWDSVMHVLAVCVCVCVVCAVSVVCSGTEVDTVVL